MCQTLQSMVRRSRAAFVLIGIIAALDCSSSMGAAPPVVTTNAGSFAVLASSSITSTGQTIIDGNIAVSPGTNIFGFPPGRVTGARLRGAAAAAAQTNLANVYNELASFTNAAPLLADIGGLTLRPGLYSSASTLEITSGDLILDAEGNPNADFGFQVGSTLAIAPGRQVVLRNGAQASEVFWQVTDSANIGAGAFFVGNILASQSITLGHRATLDGRALTQSGDVILDNNVVTTPFNLGTNLPADVFILSPITLNRQTGLFEQSIRASHPGFTNILPAVVILVRGLPSDVTVYNANATNRQSGEAAVTYPLPIGPGQFVDFLVEYYRASREPFTQPTFSARGGMPGPGRPGARAQRILSVDRNVLLQSGRFLIEFTATPGNRYVVQYNSNPIGTNAWRTAGAPITAPANRVQWLDDGPPKTDSPPGSVSNRLYRVVELVP